MELRSTASQEEINLNAWTDGGVYNPIVPSKIGKLGTTATLQLHHQSYQVLLKYFVSEGSVRNF